MKINKLSLPFLAFLQATGLLIYISLVSLFMFNADKVLGPETTFLGPIAFLLLFIVSATISASLVIGRVGILFWDKRYNEAFTLLGWTVAWSVFYLIAVLLFLFISR